MNFPFNKLVKTILFFIYFKKRKKDFLLFA